MIRIRIEDDRGDGEPRLMATIVVQRNRNKDNPELQDFQILASRWGEPGKPWRLVGTNAINLKGLPAWDFIAMCVLGLLNDRVEEVVRRWQQEKDQ